MSQHRFSREQVIPRPLEDVFAFFSDAANLQAITPPWLHFRIVTPRPIVMRPGTLIEYEIRWRVIRIRWVTEIRKWAPPHAFTDVQLKGPYRRWEHTHRFQAVPGGTCVTDEVHYALPLGPLGGLVHAIRVRRDLQAIFDYRALRIAEILPERVQ